MADNEQLGLWSREPLLLSNYYLRQNNFPQLLGNF